MPPGQLECQGHSRSGGRGPRSAPYGPYKLGIASTLRAARLEVIEATTVAVMNGALAARAQAATAAYRANAVEAQKKQELKKTQQPKPKS